MMVPVEPLTAESRLGEVYLTSEELRTRVRELGREISRDYDGLEPLLVAPLKASIVFVADLSRALGIHHGLDFIELASYAAGADQGGQASIRLLKDLDAEITGRHVLIVEDVIDTGLTLNYLCKTLALRDPASLAAVTLLDLLIADSWTTFPSATWASPCPTSCSWAMGSTSTSVTGTCPTCTSSAEKFSLG